MKIYDIAQELFGSVVFPGDPAPKKDRLKMMDNGDLYNLTTVSMCAHNGTHVDAPSHFIRDGKNIDEISLDSVVGKAYVAEHEGVVTAEDIKTILKNARAADSEAAKRILVKGKAELSYEAAQVLVDEHILLYGNESQTVGPESAPMATHQLMLGAEVVLLEGVRLGEVSCGVYLLSAAPINFGGVEGAPCRAILIDIYE